MVDGIMTGACSRWREHTAKEEARKQRRISDVLSFKKKSFYILVATLTSLLSYQSHPHKSLITYLPSPQKRETPLGYHPTLGDQVTEQN